MACGDEMELLSNRIPAIHGLYKEKHATSLLARAEARSRRESNLPCSMKELTVHFVSDTVLFTPPFETLIIFLPFTAATCHNILP